MSETVVDNSAMHPRTTLTPGHNPTLRIDGRCDGRRNMRLDCEMFERTISEGIARARVYEWDGAWVSLGKSQVPEVALRCPSEVNWVMRPTGGGAVLHGNDLTIALSLPVREGTRAIRPVYREVVSPIVEALNGIGVSAILAEELGHCKTGRSSSDCFVTSSPNDVICKETQIKLAGCALAVRRNAVLLQCSIPVGPSLIAASKIFTEFGAPSSLVLDMGSLAKAARESLSRLLSRYNGDPTNELA